VTLVKAGFLHRPRLPPRRAWTFVIQGGDPRGDGEGGPGYTVRDELNELPYLRGTVGIALDWADTGGSQSSSPIHRSRTSTPSTPSSDTSSTA